MIDDAREAQRLAQSIVSDLRLYHGEGSPPSEKIVEARTLYRSRVAPAHYELFERAVLAPSTAPRPRTAIWLAIALALAAGAAGWFFMRQ